MSHICVNGLTHMSTLHIWTSHDAYERVMSHICVSGLIRMSMSHIWTSHATHDRVMLQPIPPGVTFSNAVSRLKARSSNVSFATFQWKETFELWVLSSERAFQMPTATHRNAQVFTSHLNESCHTYEGLHLWHDTDDGRHVTWFHRLTYGVATISRLLKMIGLFCKRALENRWYSAKETYHFKEPTNRSHPISWFHLLTWHMTDHMTMMESR